LQYLRAEQSNKTVVLILYAGFRLVAYFEWPCFVLYLHRRVCDESAAL